MEYVQLKNTDMRVSRFCMGGCPMGGFGWGETKEQDFLNAIHTALDKGVNYFDTADTYGLGQSERTLAKGLGSQRKNVVIQSKFGVRVHHGVHGQTIIDNSPEYIREALHGTLRRLKTDYIDIYVVHYWDQKTSVEIIVDELKRLRQEGKIRYFGISNICDAHIDLWTPYKGDFVSGQYEFSLACRSHEDEIKHAVNDLDISPLTWGSLGQGILSGKYNRDNVDFGSDDRRSRAAYVNFHGEKLEHNLRIVDKLRKLADSNQKSVASCAVRFILDYLADSVVIVGIKNVDQLTSNLEAMDWHLSKEELEMLDHISLEIKENAI